MGFLKKHTVKSKVFIYMNNYTQALKFKCAGKRRHATGRLLRLRQRVLILGCLRNKAR